MKAFLRLPGIGINMLLGLLLMACSYSVRDAQTVVAEADSLWHEGRMYGIDEGDSTTLAQAYQALRKHAFVHCTSSLCTSYAHSCYHYGRLLRRKDDPVSAMQVFIDATHSRTRDYHILGRVYSNMGSICHLAGEYQLSYDMFEKSADCFLQNKDTINYYYALNDMAYEMAEQGNTDEAIILTDSILRLSENKYIHTKVLETRMILYKRVHAYDSVFLYANAMSLFLPDEPTLLISKAQSFYYLNQYDSAVYYANRTLEKSDDLFNIDNAYYILIHCDSIKATGNVYLLSASRADIEKEIEIRHGKLCVATQLLEQDLKRKLDYCWLYAVIVTLFVTGIIVVVYISMKRKRHTLLSQKIRTLQDRNEEVASQMRAQVEESCIALAHSPTLKEDLCWKDYGQMCNIVNQHFGFVIQKIQDSYNLSEREIRLCVLTMLNLGYDHMADMLYYSPNGIGKLKTRVAHKLGTTVKDLRHYLIQKAFYE